MGKPNAYSLFVRDIAKQRERNGQRTNYNALFSELGSTWSKMSDNEKQRYKDRAKNANYNSSYFDDTPSNLNNMASNLQDKKPLKSEPNSNLDSRPDLKRKEPADEEEPIKLKKPKLGVPGWKREQGKTTYSEARTYFDQQLYDMYQHCAQIIKSRPEFVKIPFYAISINTLCKHKKDNQNFFIPIEIGIYAYSINKGRVGDPYHVLIDAGEPPKGYFNAAADHALKTHKISFPPRNRYPKGARLDYKAIYNEVLKYIEPGERTVLISQARDYNQVVKCLEWLHSKATEDGSKLPRVSTWTILPVIEFVACMHDNIYQGLLRHPTPKFANRYYMKTLVESCTLDYNSTHMCYYHEKEENQTQWCARSCATKTLLSLEPIFEEIYELYKIATAPRELPPASMMPLRLDAQPVVMAIEAPPPPPSPQRDERINLDPRLRSVSN